MKEEMENKKDVEGTQDDVQVTEEINEVDGQPIYHANEGGE